MFLKCNPHSNLYHSWKPPFVFHPRRHLWCQVGSLKLTPLSSYPSHRGWILFFWFLFFLLVTERIALGFSLFDYLLIYLGNRTSLAPPCQINPSHMTIIVIIITIVIIILLMVISGPGTTLGVLFCFFNLFIYFMYLFLLCWVFVAACGLSLVAVSGGYSSLQCAGFLLRWLLLLQSTGSRRVGFSSCSMWAQ